MSAAKPKLKKRPQLSERTYRKKVLELAYAYLIITPCNSCGSPVNQGYVCIFCDDNDPQSEYES